MNTLKRLLPFIWPHRWKLFWSFAFGIMVAVFWGLNLTTAYPMVKVLLQGQSLQDYVDKQIEDTEKEIEKHKALLNSDDNSLAARSVDNLSTQEHKLSGYIWLKESVVDYLPRDAFQMLSIILIVFFLGTVIKAICIYVQELLSTAVFEGTTRDLRKACFRKTLTLDQQTLSSVGSGEMMARFTNDFSQLGVGLRLFSGKLIREPLKAGVCIALAFWINWRLTLMSFVFLPTMGLLFYYIGRSLKRASRRQLESMSRLYKTIDETYVSTKVVLGFNQIDRANESFSKENHEYYRKAMKIAKIDAATKPATEVLGIAAAFVALFPGAYMVLNSTKTIWGIDLASEPMDVASLGVMYVLLIGTLDPIRKLSTFYPAFKRATAAADRIFELMEYETRVVEAESATPLARHEKSIRFEDIEFTYHAFDETYSKRLPALNGVSLEINAGEVIAIVGENGSGKSTLVNLLPRFYDADAGRVLIDDVDITQATFADLRGQLGIVTQETLLFDQSIIENLRYGRENATREEIEAAAKQARVSDFIESLPDGYDTQVGEKGGRLSGGQRQRIALARAILRDPAILILDEATSAVDAQSEALIHESLRDFVAGRTTLMVTHKVTRASLEYIDRIVVMDRGQIAAVGPHETLLESCPIYQRLFENQAHRAA